MHVPVDDGDTLDLFVVVLGVFRRRGVFRSGIVDCYEEECWAGGNSAGPDVLLMGVRSSSATGGCLFTQWK